MKVLCSETRKAPDVPMHDGQKWQSSKLFSETVTLGESKNLSSVNLIYLESRMSCLVVNAFNL